MFIEAYVGHTVVIEYGTAWLFSACVITLLMTGVFYNILCILFAAACGCSNIEIDYHGNSI